MPHWLLISNSSAALHPLAALLLIRCWGDGENGTAVFILLCG
ncbi:MAG: hypothetical protein R3E31_30730 [Chloroflexota bacterium]